MHKTWTDDLLAGAIVFLVALPLCLGIALASNAPLFSGILAGIVGGLVVGAMSGSHTSVSGPAAGLTAIVAAQIATLGSFEAFLLAVTFAGVLQIVFGLMRLGFVAAFFPASVIKGLLAAIGIILVLKQLPHLVGWDADFNGEMAFWQADSENTFSELINMFAYFQEGALLIGIVSLAMLIFLPKFHWVKQSSIPVPLLVVVAGLLISYFLPFLGASWQISAKHLVQVPITNSFEGFASLLRTPDFSQLLKPAMLFAAISIAIVASLETLLNLDAVDKIDPKQRRSPPNRELVAQGTANMLLGLIGGLPVTSVVIRSSVNLNAGAHTKLSAIFHGVLLLLSVVLLAPFINLIPLSCLAAILIVTGLKLANEKIVKQMWAQGMNQFLPFAVTVTAIVFTDLLVGVAIGLMTAALFILRSNLKRPLQVIDEQHFGQKVVRIVLANQVSFLNKAALQRAFLKLKPGEHIILDGSHTDYLDADIIDLIIDFRDKTAHARGIELSFVGFKTNFALQDRVRYDEYSTSQLRQDLTPNQVLKIIKDGHERVRRGQRLKRDLARQISGTATGQFPLGVFLSCMDSRVPVELIFDLGIGDIFSTRIAGHVVSPKVLGSLEFACAIAGAKLIVVMGHTRCGAVSAAIDFYQSQVTIAEKTGCEHLSVLVHDIQKVVSREPSFSIGSKGSLEREKFEDRMVRENVIECMDIALKQSSTLKRLVKEGKIAMIGCVYDVGSGEIDFVREINHSAQPEPAVSHVSPIGAPDLV